MDEEKGQCNSPQPSLHSFQEPKRQSGSGPEIRITPADDNTATFDTTFPRTPPWDEVDGSFTNSSLEQGNSSENDEFGSIKTELESLLEKYEFVPISSLQSLFNPGKVRDEYSHLLRSGAADELDILPETICHGNSNSSGYRMVFAVLLIIDKPETIRNFIRLGIDDSHLPLQRIKNESGHRLQYEGVDFGLEDWTRINYCNFVENQWKVNVPVFWQDEGISGEFRTFHDETVLPWIDKQEVQRESGGHSDVYLVNIHKNHHSFHSQEAQGYSPAPKKLTKLAIKNLRAADDGGFKRELEVLKRFNQADEPHIVRLLTAFKYKDQFHLVFPWAEGGNLVQLWKMNPEAPVLDSEKSATDTIKWIAQQCHGIAQALWKVHFLNQKLNTHPTTQQAQEQHVGLQVPPRENGVEYGTHGDIKPMNILWFRPVDGGLGSGCLKISDFGMTNFKSKMTPDAQKFTQDWQFGPTYKPPESMYELDIRIRTSRAVDIWTLGCVYLEFITWALEGWEAVERFENERINDVAEDNGHGEEEILEDTFFDMQTVDSIRKPSVKKSVARWMNSLRQNRHCTGYLYKFLDMVEQNMLVADPGKRWKCDEIEKRLEELLKEMEEFEGSDHAISPVTIGQPASQPGGNPEQGTNADQTDDIAHRDRSSIYQEPSEDIDDLDDTVLVVSHMSDAQTGAEEAADISNVSIIHTNQHQPSAQPEVEELTKSDNDPVLSARHQPSAQAETEEATRIPNFPTHDTDQQDMNMRRGNKNARGGVKRLKTKLQKRWRALVAK